MKNKLICIMLCFIIAALSVTGCARNSQNPGSTVTGTCNYKEFITVDVYDEFANYQGIQSGWFAKAVKDRFNMELNIIAPNISVGYMPCNNIIIAFITCCKFLCKFWCIIAVCLAVRAGIMASAELPFTPVWFCP